MDRLLVEKGASRSSERRRRGMMGGNSSGGGGGGKFSQRGSESGSIARRSLGESLRSSRAALGQSINFLLRGGRAKQRQNENLRKDSVIPKDFEVQTATSLLSIPSPKNLVDTASKQSISSQFSKHSSGNDLFTDDRAIPMNISDDDYFSACSVPHKQSLRLTCQDDREEHRARAKKTPTADKNIVQRMNVLEVLETKNPTENHQLNYVDLVKDPDRLVEFQDSSLLRSEDLDSNLGDMDAGDGLLAPSPSRKTKAGSNLRKLFNAKSIDFEPSMKFKVRNGSARSGEASDDSSHQFYERRGTSMKTDTASLRANVRAMLGFGPSSIRDFSQMARTPRQAASTVNKLSSLTSNEHGPTLPGKSKFIGDDLFQSLLSNLPEKYVNLDVNQLYSTGDDHQTLKMFYKAMSKTSQTILLIKDSNNYVFGAFCSQQWTPQNKYYGDGDCFVFTLWPRFNVYKWSRLNLFFQFSNNSSIGVGGGFEGDFGIFLDADLRRGFSGFCETFTSPCLASEKDFECFGIEVWGMSRKR